MCRLRRSDMALPDDLLVFASASGTPHLRVLHDRDRHQHEGAPSFMGHASITVTFDLYGHLMPGSKAEGAALLDVYLNGRPKEIEDDEA